MTPRAARPEAAAARWILVLNPRAQVGEAGRRAAVRMLEGRVGAVQVVETAGDGHDAERIAAALREAIDARGIAARRDGGVAGVIAAGGDGTTRDVAQALVCLRPGDGSRGRGPRVPPLALLPLGTANNFARAFGLESVRRGGDAALGAAIDAALEGPRLVVDLGRCNERCFAGSVAIGLDADILARRNRLRARLGLTGGLGGYPLYLASCAIELARRHGARATLQLDGEAPPGLAATIENLLATTTPIYAGEFRFVGSGSSCSDGVLDLHVSRGRSEYVREYATAWRRHVRAARGAGATPSPRVRQFRHLSCVFARPIAWQIDGEEQRPTADFEIQVLPGALTVCARRGFDAPL